MPPPIQHTNEPRSNADRESLTKLEPHALRTFTPTQAVLAHSAGVYHWTPEGRRLYDFTSGVLVSNLGHNPRRWTQRFLDYLGWSARDNGQASRAAFFQAVPLTAYNAVTEVEIE